MSKKCPKCGKENEDVASFCANCGYSFNSDFNSKEVESTKNLSITIENNGSRSTIRLPSLKVILVIFALLIVLVLVVSNQVGHVGNNQGVTDNSYGEVKEITLIKENIKGSVYKNSEGKIETYYYVDGAFKNLPKKIDGYNLILYFYDDEGKYIGEDDAYMPYVKEYSDKSEPYLLGATSANGVRNLSYVQLEMTDPNGDIVLNETINYDINKLDLSDIE